MLAVTPSPRPVLQAQSLSQVKLPLRRSAPVSNAVPLPLPLPSPSPIPAQLQPPHVAHYDITDLLDRALNVPPDVQALAEINTFIAGKNLQPADVDNQPESLLCIVDRLGASHPRAYGIPRQSALLEMRLRLVVRALRAFAGLVQNGAVDNTLVAQLFTSFANWRSMHRKGFCINHALEFKVHEAYSLVASLKTTQTRTERYYAKVKSAVLLGASIASTLLPFLAVRVSTPLGAIPSVDSGSGSSTDVKAGVIGADLAYNIVAQRPKPAGWFPTYEALRTRLHDLFQAQQGKLPEAAATEAELAAELGALQPKLWRLWPSYTPETPAARRIFLLGVLDLMERLAPHMTSPASMASCLPTLWQTTTHPLHGALRKRAMECLLEFRSQFASHQFVDEEVRCQLESLYLQASFKDDFAAVEAQWEARRRLRSFILQER